MSNCVNHEGIRAEALCLNCQKLFCPSCLNSFGQCAPCGARFPRALKRVTAADNEAMRLGRGLRRRAPRSRVLPAARFVVGGLIIAAIGSAAYFQFDLIRRSLPQKGLGGGVAGKAHDPGAQGRDLEDALAKVAANQTTAEDEKRLDSLMSDIERGKEDLSVVARARASDQPRRERPDDDSPTSVYPDDDDPAPARPTAAADEPHGAADGAGRDWFREATELLGKARDGLMGLVGLAGAGQK